jgi:hypothetical protein
MMYLLNIKFLKNCCSFHKQQSGRDGPLGREDGSSSIDVVASRRGELGRPKAGCRPAPSILELHLLSPACGNFQRPLSILRPLEGAQTLPWRHARARQSARGPLPAAHFAIGLGRQNDAWLFWDSINVNCCFAPNATLRSPHCIRVPTTRHAAATKAKSALKTCRAADFTLVPQNNSINCSKACTEGMRLENSRSIKKGSKLR